MIYLYQNRYEPGIGIILIYRYWFGFDMGDFGYIGIGLNILRYIGISVSVELYCGISGKLTTVNSVFVRGSQFHCLTGQNGDWYGDFVFFCIGEDAGRFLDMLISTLHCIH